ncbi:hypothetical protein N7540_004283 [Penicillium herquei]|nr:hypothetical protein N7540_004283 [Penicillium herquei]
MVDNINIRDELRCAAQLACDLFHSQGTSVLGVEHIFCTTPVPAVEEHGTLCPLLGRRFTGVDEVKRYFQLLHETLFVDHLQIPRAAASTVSCTDLPTNSPSFISDLWLVDVEESAVVVVGTVTWTNRDSLKQWTGKISFHMRFAQECRREVEKSEWKVHQMEIWTDATARTTFTTNGSAYGMEKEQISDYVRQPGQLRDFVAQAPADIKSLVQDDLDTFDLGGP